MYSGFATRSTASRYSVGSGCWVAGFGGVGAASSPFPRNPTPEIRHPRNVALACSGRGPLAVPPGLIRSACSHPDTTLCRATSGDHRGRGHKKTLARQGRELLAVPPWLMLPHGASTHGALSRATPSSAT